MQQYPLANPAQKPTTAPRQPAPPAQPPATGTPEATPPPAAGAPAPIRQPPAPAAPQPTAPAPGTGRPTPEAPAARQQPGTAPAQQPPGTRTTPWPPTPPPQQPTSTPPHPPTGTPTAPQARDRGTPEAPGTPQRPDPAVDRLWADASLLPPRLAPSPGDAGAPAATPEAPGAPRHHAAPGERASAGTRSAEVPPYLTPGPDGSALLPHGTPPASGDGTRPLDGIAVAAFVLSLFGGVVVSHVLGVLGLRRTQDGHRRGREFALAGLVIATVWLLVLATAGAVGRTTLRGRVAATDLKVGNCVQGSTEGEVSRVKVVACTSPHTGQVVGNFTVDGTAFPGDEELTSQATQRCPDYAPAGIDAQLAIFYLVPTTGTWAEGDHVVSCLVVSDGDPLTAPLG